MEYNVNKMTLAKQTITKTEKIHYKGKLYNLTTSSGNIIVNGILCKNSGGLGTPAHERVVAGMIHKSHMGVLFVDEIATLQPYTQQELLSSLQEKKFAITGQSERSAGAMVRTEPVPCLTPDILININGKKMNIGDYWDKLSDGKIKVNKNQEIIPSFCSDDKTISFNGGFQKDVPLLITKTWYNGQIIEIEFEDGSRLEVTPDHPIVTKNGLKNAVNLNEHDIVLTYDSERNIIINEVDIIGTYSKENQRIAYAYLTFLKLSKNMRIARLSELLSIDESSVRAWRRGKKPKAFKALERLASLGLCPLSTVNRKLKLLARITGALFGDGGISRNRVYFSVGLDAKEDAAEFIEDLEKIFGLDYLKRRISIRNTGKGYDVSLNDAYISRLFRAIGVPANDKVSQKFHVPEWVYSNAGTEREFFSGLISSELYGNIRHISAGCSFVMVKLTKYETEHIQFLNSLRTYLHKCNIKTTEVKKSSEYNKKTKSGYETAARYYFKFATNHSDLLKLMECMDVRYANRKKESLTKLAQKSKCFKLEKIQFNKKLKLVRHLRRRGCTIRQISKDAVVAKNTVLKYVNPTYNKYDGNFKDFLLDKFISGENKKWLSDKYGVPMSTLNYWCRNEK